jgi:hypothetical protein
MKKLKLITCVGTRPEIIKLSRCISLFDKYFDHIFIHTGQNFSKELSQVFFSDLKIRRPDYFLKMGETGILMEVERGKTNQNNMDFLDIWKCHICRHAHYLFLCVPIVLRQNDSGNIGGKPFDMVSSHLQSFFIPQNYVNVRGAFVIGY